jgi:hypothetical protein
MLPPKPGDRDHGRGSHASAEDAKLRHEACGISLFPGRRRCSDGHPIRAEAVDTVSYER